MWGASFLKLQNPEYGPLFAVCITALKAPESFEEVLKVKFDRLAITREFLGISERCEYSITGIARSQVGDHAASTGFGKLGNLSAGRRAMVMPIRYNSTYT